MWSLRQLGLNEYTTWFITMLVLFVVTRSRKRRPPGPPRLPAIGNLHQMTLSQPLWEKAAEWRNKYGDLVYIECVGIPVLIVNSYETASDLLVKRSAIYSSRPYLIMTNELQDWGWATSQRPYGETLRKQRAYLHMFFQTSEVLNYFELQERETYVMLNGILTAPEDYAEHVRRLPGAVILRNVYGYEVQDINDPLVLLGEKVLRTGADSLRYLFLDFVPWLKYLPEGFPGFDFPKAAREGRELSKQFRFTAHEMTKRKLIEGTGKECMTSILLSENMLEDGSFRDEQNICDAGAIAFLGGSDTSVTAIMSFILAMLKHPEKQRRARAEIDAAIGLDRLPNLSDKDSLRYVQAICTEIFRWEVILPIGLAHSLTEDNEYMGYQIPAGTMVIPNVWVISRDPDRYSDPLSFKPERWMPGETEEGVPTLRPQDYTFGFGRRVCPGQGWAEHIVFLAVASILAAFDIEKMIGPDGEPIPLTENYLPSPVRSLGASKCHIRPRSEKAASLVRQAFASL